VPEGDSSPTKNAMVPAAANGAAQEAHQ
jgi:hypothetical protein